MGRSQVGNKLDSYSGLTSVLSANTLQVRNSGTVRAPGRIRALGAYLGANGSPVAKNKLVAYDLKTLWSPSLFSPLAWFKADAITGLTDGQAVASWVNSGSNTNPATQATAANRPVYKTNIQNGLPVVRFDGVNDDLAATPLNIPAAVSIFTVFKTTADTTANQYAYVTSGSRHALLLHASPNQAHMVQNPSTLLYSGTEPLSTWEVHSHIYSPTAMRAARNGVTVTGGAASGGANVDILALGSSGGVFWADIDLAEFIIIPSVMSLSDQQAMEGYLAWKWGIVLDPSHPFYKSFPTLAFDSNNLDPVTKLAESAPFNIDTIWTSDGAGGANYEQNIDRLWTPADLPTGWVKFWWKGDTVSDTAVDAALAQLTDISGFGNHATQGTAGNRALLRANAINGHMAADFDGVDDYYNLPGVSSIAPSQSIYAIIRFADRPVNQAFIAFTDNTNGLGLYVSSPGDLALYKQGVTNIGTTTGFPVPDDVATLVSGSFASGSSWSVWVNGNGWGGTTAQTLSIPAIGYRIGWIDSNTPDGYISEIIITQPFLPSPYHVMMEGYLAWANGTQTSLNPLHPYLSAPPRVHGSLVLPGQQIAVGLASSGSLRRPSKFFLGGKRWEQSAANVVLPDPMMPTVETVDDRDLSSYAIIEENRPPVVEMLTPGNFSLVNDNKPTFSVYHSDPDRTEGYGDYIKYLLARAYENYRGALVPAGYRSGIYDIYTGAISPIAVGWGALETTSDLGTRMTASYYPNHISQADGTALSLLPDGSGNGNNAIQNTVANQPTFRTFQILGTYHAVDFDGVNDYMNMPGVIGNSEDEAFFCVIKFDVVNAYQTIISGGTGGRMLRLTSGGFIEYGKYGSSSTISTLGPAAGSWYVVHFVMRSGALRIGMNGTMQNFSYSPGFTAGLNTSYLGTSDATPVWLLNGMIAHVIRMKASELRPGDEERIIAFLAWRYGLQGQLPTTFMYRNIQPGLRISPPPSTEQNNAAGAAVASTNRWNDPLQVDGTAVSTWVDSRGQFSPQSATQGTAANQPIYRANVVNGRGAVEFDGINDYLATTLSASTWDDTLFAVIKLQKFTPNASTIRGPGSSNGLVNYVTSVGGLAFGPYALSGIGSTSIGNVVPGEWAIVHWSLTATTWEMGINGKVERGTHSMTLPAGLTSWFGWQGDLAGTNIFTGQIAKIVRMSTAALAIDDIDRWVGRLAWEYGLQGKLPDSHMYKFNSPDDPVEHHWTAEIKDEVGGITGTGYGAIDLDTNTPDGTTAFYPHLNGYFIPGYPLGKITARTPTLVSGTYTHPLSTLIDKVQIKILKKGLTGEYGEDQVSPWIDITNQATGTLVSIPWRMTGFSPLDIGFDYRSQMRSLDQNGQVGPWSGNGNFHTNYVPDQGIVTSPTNRTPVTSPPLSLFSVNDNDDTGVAYFAGVPYLIPETMWGSLGSATNQFNGASQIATDGSDNVYVADTINNRLSKFDANGTYITGIASLPGVKGVAVDVSGNIYVTCATGTDQTYRKYTSALGLVWSQQFTPLSSYKLGFLTTDNAYLYMTLDNNIGSFPKIYKILTTDGSIPLTWGTPGSGNGQMRSPQGIHYFNGEVYVVDTGNRRILVFNTVGVYQRQISSDNLSTDQFTGAVGIQVNPNTGNIWIPSIPRNTVQEISQLGELVREYGGSGIAAGKFRIPKGITFNNLKTKLYTMEQGNNRVQRLRVPLDSDLTGKGVSGELLVRGPIYVPNQTFDSDTANWTYFERAASFINTNVTSTLAPYSGAGFARVTMTAGPSVAHIINTFGFASSSMVAVPGFVYRAKFRFRRSKVGVYGQIGIEWYDDGGSLINTSWGEIVRPAVGTWFEASVADEAPPGTSYAIVEIDAGVESGITYPFDADFDAVEIEDGVRYLRGGTFVSGGNFSYQLTSTDMPVKGTYSIQARGRDGNSEGPWSDAVVIDFVDGPTATVVSPTSGQVFSTATPIFSWILTAGTQWGYKVEVLDTNGVTVYDSGWVQGESIRSHQVPITAGLQDGVSYVGRLWIDNGTLQVLV